MSDAPPPVTFSFRISCGAEIGTAPWSYWGDLPEPLPHIAEYLGRNGQPVRWRPDDHEKAQARRLQSAGHMYQKDALDLDSRRCIFNPSRLTLAGTVTAHPPTNPWEWRRWSPHRHALMIVQGTAEWTLRLVYFMPGRDDPDMFEAAGLPSPVDIRLTERRPRRAS